MSETDNQTHGRTAWWSPAAALTPKGSAIAGFTLAAVSLLGQSAWTNAAQSLFFGQNFPQSSLHWYVAVSVAAPTLSAVVGLLLARRVIVAPADGWELHLSRATVVVAEIGVVLGAIAVLGNLLRS